MISSAITTALHDLLDPSDHDLDHLAAPFDALTRDLAIAVPSLVGLHLALSSHDQPFELRWWRPGSSPDQVTTSFHLPLASLLGSSGPRSGGFTWWATTPGAFVDLAADLAYALTIPHESLALDRHLTDLMAGDGFVGAAEAAVINQAVGALIAEGHHPDDVRGLLAERAAAAGLSIDEHARRFLASLSERDPG